MSFLRLTILIAGLGLATACSVSPPRTTPPIPTPEPRLATGMSGPWMLTIESPMGRDEVEATFNQNGERLTGTVFSAGREVPLEGTVNGEQVDFGMSLNVRGESLQLDYSGIVDGDNMSGTVRFGPIGTGKFSAKRKVSDPSR